MFVLKEYENYHKHDSISNIYLPDSHVKPIDYINRIKELGYGCYFTTNHGTGGDVFESLTACKEAGIRCLYGVEGYIVKDPLEKDKRNYHIVIIPTTNKARKKLNLVTSRSNIEGFYYRPRIFPEDLLALDPEDVYITTACVAGIVRDKDSIVDIFMPLMKHFGNHMLLEVQNHNEPNQIAVNKTCLALSKKFGLELIAANDSHYIYPEQAKERLDFLRGKGLTYGDEDGYILDFPDYDTLFARFQKQGVLSDEQIKKAIANTLIFRECEDIEIDKSIKMPTVYPNLTADEKIKELKKHVVTKFKDIINADHISKDELVDYKNGIAQEMKVIEDTKEINTADYFLLNEKLVDLAVNKYGGILTRTGRGSCGGFYINRILGMTQLDRFKLDIKLYPERFMSTARLLENRAMPDIDFNVVSQEPFANAAKKLLGEHGCYPMIAYGTMKLGESFRNVCRSHGLAFDDYNEVAKDIENHMNDKRWLPYIEEAQTYMGTVVSASVHPCAFLLDNKDIREEYGVVKVGDAMCAMITSGEADEYKMLKDDFLVVTVYRIISDTFNLIGKPIISVSELLNSLDEKVWNIFANGLTCTLNQADGDWATSMLKQFKPHSVSDMAMFTACLRPFFEPWRDKFINREDFTTGSSYLDEVLTSTHSYILFQENLMQYFEWLGVTPAESIGLIKKISKKKIHPEDFKNLEERIKAKWIDNTGSIDDFEETWQMVQSCMSYGFCSAHAVATGIDCLYGAYLKANYPLEYYTCTLSLYADDIERTSKLIAEMPYFNIKLLPIQFGKSGADYTMDKDSNCIYKGIESIKFCNRQIADELLELSKNKYDSFTELLKDIKDKTSINSRQLTILISLNFFSDFGKNRYLLDVVDIYDKFANSKIIAKKKMEELGVSDYLMQKYAGKETKSQWRQLDNQGLINELCNRLENKSLDIVSQVRAEMDYLGYVNYVNSNMADDYYIVTGFVTYKNPCTPNLVLRRICDGEEIGCRIKQSKVFKETPFGMYSILKIEGFTYDFKNKKINGEWQKSDEREIVLENYECMKG